MAEVARGASTFPPLNLAYLAAIAENNGHTVQIIDGEAENLTIREMVKSVEDFDPDLIGITTTTPFFHIAVEQAWALKNALETPIVIGGPHVTYFREKVFFDCFDYLVIGQCEQTFGEFLKQIENQGDIANIPGILSRVNGNICFSGENPQLEDLDETPTPARHLFKSNLYHVGTMRGKKKYTSIMTSRGCPFKCVFCSTSIYGNRVRRRSIDKVVNEIGHVINDLGIDHFYFLDDTLTLNRGYILSLCDEIEKQSLKFTWEGGTRANLVDETLIKRMAECGLIRISFGLESADLNVRRIIKKNVPLESYYEANKLTNKYGIETINSVMLGLPGDTYESINKTISYVRSSRTIKHATFGIAIPYPGSEMYDMALKGEYGLKVETLDYSKYQRYNSAVMTVNGITPKEMLQLQKKGLMQIYLVPWRIIPVLRRFGIKALIKPFINAVAALMKNTKQTRGCM